METKILARFESAEYGVETIVAEVASGYSVALLDLDSGEYLESVIIFNTLDGAIAKAKTIF